MMIVATGNDFQDWKIWVQESIADTPAYPEGRYDDSTTTPSKYTVTNVNVINFMSLVII